MTASAANGVRRQSAAAGRRQLLFSSGYRPMAPPTAASPSRFPATVHASGAGRSRAEAKDPMAPVTGPRSPSGQKTGISRRTADARFSTTGGISPDSPQSRSASMRDRTPGRTRPDPAGLVSSWRATKVTLRGQPGTRSHWTGVSLVAFRRQPWHATSNRAPWTMCGAVPPAGSLYPLRLVAHVLEAGGRVPDGPLALPVALAPGNVDLASCV